MKLSDIKKKINCWNYFHLHCQALSDAVIASSSQEKVSKLHYLAMCVFISAFERSGSVKDTVQNKYLLRDAYSLRGVTLRLVFFRYLLLAV